jgi:hypothetical protein
VLWHHYENDIRQQAMCSRLVAFYALMARGRGEWINGKTKEPPFSLPAAALSAAFVNAVATAPVEGGRFEEAAFESVLERYSKGSVPSREHSILGGSELTDCRLTTRLAVTQRVQQLCVQLFAFQSCIAVDPARATPRFRALEQLCVRVADIGGDATLQPMLFRAWRATLSDFPWLQYAPPSHASLLKVHDTVQPAPSFREAMKCEMAILGALIELLRALLGDAVTIHLLRSLWPLANLDIDTDAISRFIELSSHDRSCRPSGRLQ